MYQFKKYSFPKLLVEFFVDKLKKRRTGHFANKDLENKAQRQENDTLKHAHNEDNVTTKDELVGSLRHKWQKQTHRLTH